jgi:GT2 family glycosyltransferase
MPEVTPRVCIVLLNWNGWRDTIECLESLYRLEYSEFFLVVVDNGSTDDSVERITGWARDARGLMPTETGIPVTVLPHDGASSTPPPFQPPGRSKPGNDGLRPRAIFLVRSAENLGFAAGCNLGMRLGLEVGCEYVWLLNNDTVVAPDSLGKLAGFLVEHADFAGVTGQIRLYREPDVVWNCGGSLLPFGLRRYDFCDAPAKTAPQTGYARISFTSGCAALLRASLMQQIGFLSERFFHGEEDFELCHRLKRKGLALACRYDALIHHKVGASITAAASRSVLATTHVYYLNRFIHMRAYWSTTFWQCWRYAYCAYVVWLLRRGYGVSYSASLTMLRAVLRESKELDGVDKATFTRLMSESHTRAPESPLAV